MLLQIGQRHARVVLAVGPSAQRHIYHFMRRRCRARFHTQLGRQHLAQGDKNLPVVQAARGFFKYFGVIPGGVAHCQVVKGGLQIGNRSVSRLVPLHVSTVEALDDYACRRDRLCTRPAEPAFFVSKAGKRLLYSSFHITWLDLVARTGLRPCSGSCRPRPHDLRHRFAVATLLDWYRDGVDVGAAMPVLSTYLGHTHPHSTYWYLSAAPELLQLVAARLDDDGVAS